MNARDDVEVEQWPQHIRDMFVKREGRWYRNEACYEYEAHWEGIARQVRHYVEAGAADIVVLISTARGSSMNWLHVCAAHVREALRDLGATYQGGAFAELRIASARVTFHWDCGEAGRQWIGKDTQVIIDPSERKR